MFYLIGFNTIGTYITRMFKNPETRQLSISTFFYGIYFLVKFVVSVYNDNQMDAIDFYLNNIVIYTEDNYYFRL